MHAYTYTHINIQNATACIHIHKCADNITIQTHKWVNVHNKWSGTVRIIYSAFDRLTQIHSPHPQEESGKRPGESEKGPPTLSRSLTYSDEDSFESACRGEEKGTVDIARWCSVYCGGSKPVIQKLKEVTKECGMNCEFETFDW